MKNIDKVQSLLPLGYLFLVTLGIVKETISYYQIGINIIRYSSIVDILISPLAAVTSHPVFFITVLLLFVFCFYLPQILLKNEDKIGFHKFVGAKDTAKISMLAENERIDYYTTISIKFLGTFLISIFLGYGFADGRSIAAKIKGKTLQYNYTLNYNDNNSEQVYIIGSNTTYYFYVTKGEQTVKIAPIASIKNIELTKNRMLNN
ncbi:hypothetical protein AR687_12920 [Flavobacteriaceae bacterium CRH]|nr:hypothetical protein AR687_12920 [Flavobacteriaceae bacterium CRH]